MQLYYNRYTSYFSSGLKKPFIGWRAVHKPLQVNSHFEMVGKWLMNSSSADGFCDFRNL